jgi:hypothetical protein
MRTKIGIIDRWKELRGKRTEKMWRCLKGEVHEVIDTMCHGRN